MASLIKTSPIAIVAGLLAGMLATPGFAQIYRCKTVDGTVVQQMPCPGQGEKLNVKPARGNAPIPQSIVADTPQPIASGITPKDKAQAQGKVLEDERIRREKWTEWYERTSAVAKIKQRCKAEQSAIRARMADSNNNLAGAMRDVSLTNELTAAAVRCDTRLREAEREVDEAAQVCAAIKCIDPHR